MAVETVTIKAYKDTRIKLRLISAITAETHLDVVERLVHKEFEKINNSQKQALDKMIQKYSK